MRLMAFVFFFCGILPNSANSSSRDAIIARTMIVISSYDENSDTYRINIQHEATGPNFTTREFLLKSIPSLASPQRLQEKPGSIVGNQYHLDQDLELLTDQEVATRKKKKHGTI